MKVLLRIKNNTTKKLECIEYWVCCFNTYTAAMALKHPEKVGDLLAYSLLIVNASRLREGTLWLDYSNHFTHFKVASGSRAGPLAQVNLSI